MKKVLYLIIILIAASCSTKHNELPMKKVTITGKIINLDPFIFTINSSINRIGIGQESISPLLDPDGSFKISFKSNIPTDVWLIYKMEFLILTHPGDSIHVEFDGSKDESMDILKTIKFSGDDSVLNNEAVAFQQLYFPTIVFYSPPDKYLHVLRDYNEVQYKLFMDSIRTESAGLYNKFLKERNPSYEFRQWAKTLIDVDYYEKLITFPEFHRYANNLKSKDWDVPITYYDFLKNHFPFNNSILISGYALTSFVNTYQVFLNKKIRAENKSFFISLDTIKRYPEKLDSLMFFGTINYTDDPLLRQMALTEILHQELEQSETRMFEKYESKIENCILEPYLREPLFKLYHQALNRLENPKLASDAILNKLKGTSLKPIIDSIISVNKGKVIYMDCWATWCGPCIAEIPNSKRLMEEYKDKDAAFIFICLDSEERNWKSVLSKYSLGGQHFLLTKNQSSYFRNAFNIKGTPQYILFDKKGNIAENETLPPLFIKDKIDKLLTEK
jgi:thiol-disulfide isomerase/thioredoxin